MTAVVLDDEEEVVVVVELSITLLEHFGELIGEKSDIFLLLLFLFLQYFINK